MARETIKSIKKKYRSELEKMKKSLWLKCAECQGFFIDGYRPCPNKNCPLRSFYPPRRTAEADDFRKKMVELAEKNKNNPEFLEKILPSKKPKKKAVKKKPAKKSLKKSRKSKG